MQKKFFRAFAKRRAVVKDLDRKCELVLYLGEVKIAYNGENTYMLELKNVCFAVHDDTAEESKRILEDISLDITEGITAITGQNGGGKSTLMKLLKGIEQPTSGSILYNGQDITAYTVTERAKLGFTIAFQQPVRFKGITVKKLLSLAAGRESSVGTLCEYLSAVGLCAKDYVGREIDGTLSGGELKRIELATAIAKGGEVFLLDEPEAGIDLWSFEELIKAFSAWKGKTVIIVTHQKKILDVADRIVLLNHNRSPVIGYRAEMLPLLQDANGVCERLRRE